MRRTPIAAGSRRGHNTTAAAKDAAASTVNCAPYSARASSANGPAAAQAAVAAMARRRHAPRHRPARVADGGQPQQHAVRGLQEEVEREAGLPVAAAGDEERGQRHSLDDPRRHPVPEIGPGIVPLEQHEEQREHDRAREMGRGGDFQGRHATGGERIIG